MRADQERVRELLTDTVTLLCKNGLHFGARLRIEGVLGITIDENDVFIVHINESISTKEGGEGVIDSSSRALPSTEILQTYRPPFRSRKRNIINVQSNQTGVTPSSITVREGLNNDLLKAQIQAENDTTGIVSVPSILPATSRLEPFVKLENCCRDIDRVNVIELDNDDDAEPSVETYGSVANFTKLSKSRCGPERDSNVTEVVDSKLKKTSNSNRRFKIPICNRSSTENGSEMDAETVMNTNGNRSSFNLNPSDGVNSSSVDITGISPKQEANDDGYWNTDMESNSEADFGISGSHDGSRRPTSYSYFDSSQSGRNGSVLFPVAAWQVASRRSSATGVQKPYKCPHVGCGLRFYHRNNVSRHCTLKHGGAGVKQRNTYPRLDTSYEMSSSFHDPSPTIYSDSNITYDDTSPS